MEATYVTEVVGVGNNAGLEVPAEILDQLGAGKRPPVLVTVEDYTYPSTVGSMGGRALIPLSKAHRDASGIRAGMTVTVKLQLETGPREVDVPADLADALTAAALTTVFAQLSYSRRKEHVRSVTDARTAQTRERRIEKVLVVLRAS